MYNIANAISKSGIESLNDEMSTRTLWTRQLK